MADVLSSNHELALSVNGSAIDPTAASWLSPQFTTPSCGVEVFGICASLPGRAELAAWSRPGVAIELHLAGHSRTTGQGHPGAMFGEEGMMQFSRHDTAEPWTTAFDGDRLDALAVCVDEELLEDMCGADARRVAALAHQHWLNLRPSASLRWMAQQVLHGPLRGDLARLQLAGVGLQLMAEGVSTLLQHGEEGGVRPDGAAARRARIAREWLDAHGGESFAPADLARVTGVNLRQLQREFRAHVGTTLVAYARDARLDCAAHALATGERTISQAAFDAGYNGAHNFATAFRRRFGFAPSELQATRQSPAQTTKPLSQMI